MKLYLTRTPFLIKLLFRNWVWSFSTRKKKLYLTFDDGPTPEVTDWVLDQLKQYNAQATFFCIGKNIDEHPALFKRIQSEGHIVGNHTHNHYKSSEYSTAAYLENVILAHKHFEGIQPKLFRPPYGKLSLKKARKLRQLGYTIVMWDVLSADFDPGISAQKCLNNVIKNSDRGSIIVFHDSKKSFDKLQFALPRILEYYSYKGFKFSGISSSTAPLN